MVAEGSDLETALLTSAKRWKQKGNRAEKCYSWAVTYLSVSLSYTHTHGHTHTDSGCQDKTHRMPQAVVTDANMLPHTYKCMRASFYEVMIFFHILVKFTLDATSSSLLVHPPVIALDFFTATVMLSVYLETLLNSRPSCLSPTAPQCHHPR